MLYLSLMQYIIQRVNCVMLLHIMSHVADGLLACVFSVARSVSSQSGSISQGCVLMGAGSRSNRSPPFVGVLGHMISLGMCSCSIAACTVTQHIYSSVAVITQHTTLHSIVVPVRDLGVDQVYLFLSFVLHCGGGKLMILSPFFACWI